MARKIPEDHKLWALYIDSRRAIADSDGDYARRQWIVLPPLENAAENAPERDFRYFYRSQSSLKERPNWKGPKSRDTNSMRELLAAQAQFREGYGGDEWEHLVITVPVQEPELLNLKWAGKPTYWRVLDRAKRVAKAKYSRII